MYNEYLSFEKTIAEITAQIKELQTREHSASPEIQERIMKLEQQNKKQTQQIFSKLTDHQIVELARHPLRPHSTDYISQVFDTFEPMSGDRRSGKSHAIIGGIARLNGMSVMVIAQEKGRETDEKIARNFGMPKPECYRFALRLFHMAEKFQLPIVSFIDTAGAYPGIDAERHNQSEAIATNIYTMCGLKTPIISLIIGEGGSGGALAVGVADRIMMLEHSVFSVISPEGCASILWKDSSRAKDAAALMQLTAPKLHKLGLIDQIIEEPLGGAHRDAALCASRIKNALYDGLMPLMNKPMDVLLEDRYAKYRAIQTN